MNLKNEILLLDIENTSCGNSFCKLTHRMKITADVVILLPGEVEIYLDKETITYIVSQVIDDILKDGLLPSLLVSSQTTKMFGR